MYMESVLQFFSRSWTCNVPGEVPIDVMNVEAVQVMSKKASTTTLPATRLIRAHVIRTATKLATLLMLNCLAR